MWRWKYLKESWQKTLQIWSKLSTEHSLCILAMQPERERKKQTMGTGPALLASLLLGRQRMVLVGLTSHFWRVKIPFWLLKAGFSQNFLCRYITVLSSRLLSVFGPGQVIPKALGGKEQLNAALTSSGFLVFTSNPLLCFLPKSTQSCKEFIVAFRWTDKKCLPMFTHVTQKLELHPFRKLHVLEKLLNTTKSYFSQFYRLLPKPPDTSPWVFGWVVT